MLDGHRQQGTCAFGQVCLPSPAIQTHRALAVHASSEYIQYNEIVALLQYHFKLFHFKYLSPEDNKIPAWVRSHAVEDVLEHLCLFV